jgi:hypothetical protein
MVRTSRVFSVPPGGAKTSKKLSGAAGVDLPPTRDQQGLLRNHSLRSLQGIQLRAVFDSINSIPTPGKLLPDIHSVKNVFIVEI